MSSSSTASHTLAIGQWFRDQRVAPEHVVALAFEANLPFLEHELLDRLHRDGARYLTVLVGAQDYRESIADLAATRHTGVFYTYHRVRLQGALAAFHPKLYLLTWRDSARLLVASANLTPSGFRSNLEVVDELQLVAGEPSDVGAFASYADLLEAIPSLDATLDARVCRRLQMATQSVRALLARCKAREEVSLLHSASRALLPQLLEHVPPTEVRRLALVSPFFDGGSAGVLGIARAFASNGKPPEIRIIKDRRALAEFDGRSLRSFGKRLRVEGLVGLAAELGITRALHAKLLVLEGPSTAWIVVGSPNATSAAWLESAASGGNLEAATVREVSLADAEALLAGLVTEPIKYEALTRIERTKVPSDSGNQLLINSASVIGEALELKCTVAKSFEINARWRARLVSREGSGVLAVDVVERDEEYLYLRTRGGSEALHAPVSAAVALELLDTGGGRYVSDFVWVDKPLFQDLPPSMRAGFRALSQLGESLDVPSADPLHDAARFLANLGGRLAAELAKFAPDAGPDHWGVAEQGEEDEEDDESDWDTDLEGDEDIQAGGEAMSPWRAASQLPGGETVRRLGGGHVTQHLEMTERLFDGLVSTGLARLEEDEKSENAAARRQFRSLGQRGSAGAGEAAKPPAGLTPSGRHLLERGLKSLERSLARVLRSNWTASQLAYRAAMLDALIAALLRFAVHLRERDPGLFADCQYRLQDAWSRVWSADGSLLGPCRGVYARALADPDLGHGLREIYAQPRRLAQMAAMAAMTAVLRHEESASAPRVPYGVLAGLELVTGGASVVETSTKSMLNDHARAFAANFGQVSEDVLLDTLKAPPFSLTSDGMLLRSWLPILRIERQRRSSGSSGKEVALGLLDSISVDVPRPIVSRYRQVVRAGRILSGVAATETGLCCTTCRNALPASSRTMVTRPDAVMTCEFCGDMLAPIAWDNPRVEANLNRLSELLATQQAELPSAGSASQGMAT